MRKERRDNWHGVMFIVIVVIESLAAILEKESIMGMETRDIMFFLGAMVFTYGLYNYLVDKGILA